tara:strand:- start:810 stop:1529 length:720 start_codon:yes stop_codon:yes gene_type:complete
MLEGQGDWEVFFIHQCDSRPFNRGAMKNIGFLLMRKKYPKHYRAITFVFHDVDTRPRYRGQFPYETSAGMVAHYHGTHYSLGGVFAIKGADFERTGGFPNFWGWGLEDNLMYDRCLKAGLRVDRRNFYPLRHPEVIRSFDGYKRVTSKREAAVYKYGEADDMRGIRDIRACPGEDGMIDVTGFVVSTDHRDPSFTSLDIRAGSRLSADRRLLQDSGSGPPVRKRIKRLPPGVIRRWPPR